MVLERDKNNGLLKWTFHQALSSLHTRRSLVSLLQEDTSGKGMLTSPVQISDLVYTEQQVLQSTSNLYITKHILICTLIYFTNSINYITW